MSNGENLRLMTIAQIHEMGARVAQVAADEAAGVVRAEFRRQMDEQREAIIEATGKIVVQYVVAAGETIAQLVDTPDRVGRVEIAKRYLARLKQIGQRTEQAREGGVGYLAN